MANPFYKTRSLIEGHKIDPKFAGKKMVCIPETKAREKGGIQYGDDCMKIDPGSPMHRLFFRDKFGRRLIYELLYYEWKPVPRPTQLLIV